MTTPSKTAERPPLRFIAWTCDECGRPNRTRTRTGSKMTCPGCEHVQLGPAQKERHAAQLAKIKARQERQERKAKSAPATATRVRVRGQGAPPAPVPAPGAEPAATPPTGPAPPPAPAPRGRSWFDRAMGY